MKPSMVLMKKLILSYADPAKWRTPVEGKSLQTQEWKNTRLRILKRDDCTCQYCGYRAEKFQIADHVDGNPNNNEDNNLQTICQMCNLIKHAGQGCVVKGIVDLYKESKHGQNEIIRITREMRDRGKTDDDIISFLGLKHKVLFKMDKKYLKQLHGFVTSRSTYSGDDMYDKWKDYHNQVVRMAR
jgi:hypothetical protein